MADTAKFIIIFILSSLSSIFVSAQKGNSFAGVRFGLAFPMGEMASQDFDNGGYALLGKSFGAEAAWFVTPKIGFGVDFSSNSFGYDAVSYAADYLANTPEYKSLDLLSAPYKLTTYMGGVYYKVSICPKFYSTFKLMGGYFRTRTPDQFFGGDIYMIGKTYFWKTSSFDSKFTFLTGASFEYKLDKRVSFLLQADFTYSEASFVFLTSGYTSYTNYLQMPVLRIQPGINIHF